MKTDYQKICASLLKGLSQRTADILEKRFGLKKGDKETLEAIGEGYGITRERVRQIVEEGLAKIQPKIKEYKDVFQTLEEFLKLSGDLKKEAVLLDELGERKFQNQVYFLMSLDKDLERVGEDDSFYSFWTRKKEAVSSAKKAIGLVLKEFHSSNR